jgi:hypothetical protein
MVHPGECSNPLVRNRRLGKIKERQSLHGCQEWQSRVVNLGGLPQPQPLKFWQQHNSPKSDTRHWVSLKSSD